MKISIIVSYNKKYVIGNNNSLIYRIPNDLNRFKMLTNHHYVLVGRKTYESIPNRLPNRKILLISNSDYKCHIRQDINVFNNIEKAIQYANNNNETDLFIIGGTSIYAQTLHIVDRIYLTYIRDNQSGNMQFPNINTYKWNIETKGIFKYKDFEYSFQNLIKK